MIYGMCEFEGIWYQPCSWNKCVVIINGNPYRPVPEIVLFGDSTPVR